MITKIINKNNSARDKLLRGISTAAETVSVTLGPRGRNVIIEKTFGAPKITKDGVSVVKEIKLKDRIENLGVEIIKEAANKTNDKAGDGTTTTIVLAESISKEGVKAVTAGINPMDLKRGIEYATEKILKQIKKSSKNISLTDEITQVATISANGDQDIGSKIALAFKKVGNNGIITVEETNKSDILNIETVEGMNFDRGYISPYFVTNTEKMICEFDKPYILIIDKKINNLNQIIKILEDIIQLNKPLLIIAEDIEGEALATLIINKIRGGLKIVAVKSPGFGEERKDILDDIAIVTNTKVYNEAIGYKIEDLTIKNLGIVKKVIVSKEETTIIQNYNKNKEDINRRCIQIKNQIINSESDYHKEKLQKRLAKLSGGVAILKVGGITEVELKEKKDRVEDAYHATKAAIAEGVVPGGGSTLLYASKSLNKIKGLNADETVGIEIIKKSLISPIKKILNNSGLESALIVEKLLEENKSYITYDAQKHKIVDAFEEGIIDPTKVVNHALKSASSVASLIITTEATITEYIKQTEEINKNFQNNLNNT